MSKYYKWYRISETYWFKYHAILGICSYVYGGLVELPGYYWMQKSKGHFMKQLHVYRYMYGIKIYVVLR